MTAELHWLRITSQMPQVLNHRECILRHLSLVLIRICSLSFFFPSYISYTAAISWMTWVKASAPANPRLGQLCTPMHRCRATPMGSGATHETRARSMMPVDSKRWVPRGNDTARVSGLVRHLRTWLARICWSRDNAVSPSMTAWCPRHTSRPYPADGYTISYTFRLRLFNSRVGVSRPHKFSVCNLHRDIFIDAMLSFYYLAPLLAASVLLFLTRIAKVGSRPAGYPPGPPTLPLLGNLHLVRSDQ